MLQFDNNQNAQADSHFERDSEFVSKQHQSNILMSKIVRTERPTFCIHCGARLEEEDRFCTECGAKIEAEVLDAEGSEKNEENESAKVEQKSPAPLISSDRMASIAETTARKLGAASDILKDIEFFRKQSQNENRALQGHSAPEQLKLESTEQKKNLLTGTYVHKASTQTMYLTIESVTDNDVKANVKSVFDNGSYALENYVGTLYGAGISLRLTNYELHTDYTIRLGESFLGLVDENSISGNFSGEFTGYCIFRKS